jgi:4-hydroxy-3-polyprenylbenzoate decarboxylase
MKTVAAIASGYASDLVIRAADVVLKERRQLVLLVRESPLSEIHLENMLKLARMGVSIVPPVPAFYNHPLSLEEMIDHVVTRALDQVGLHSGMTPRWDGRLRSGRPARLGKVALATGTSEHVGTAASREQRTEERHVNLYRE